MLPAHRGPVLRTSDGTGTGEVLEVVVVVATDVDGEASAVARSLLAGRASVWVHAAMPTMRPTRTSLLR